MTETIVIKVDREEQKKPKRAKTLEGDKYKVKSKLALFKLKLHSKAMFKGGSAFFKHLFLSLLFALQLLGLALKAHGKRMNKDKPKGEEKQTLRW